MYMVGNGTLWGTNLPDSGVATPIKFGAIQEVSIDFSFSTKELRGQFQFPLDVARVGTKVMGKAKAAWIDGSMFAQLFFNQALDNAMQNIAKEEAHTIPGTPYTVTGTAGASVLCLEDLGVIDAVTLQRYTKVASGPTTGQYSVAIGASTGITYTFAAADTTKNVLISYRYEPATGLDTFTLTNQLIGAAPNFKVNLVNTYRGKDIMISLFRCISSKLTFPFKREDYLIPEFDFEAMDDGSGNIGVISNTISH